MDARTVEWAPIRVLRKGSLSAYRNNLEALRLYAVLWLYQLEPGLFHGLLRLREISVQKAPSLAYIAAGVLADLPSLRVLRITHSGLESVPSMHQLKPSTHIGMLDFESNRINVLQTGCLRAVEAGTVILNHNAIRVVRSHAFNGSAIAELRLRGNRELTTIEDSAFVGLSNLIRLDLSETSLTQLPTRGLEGVEVLELRDVSSLQRFPSVYHFRFVREAHLTYPYHCCAFQFPETHNPEEHARFQQSCQAAPPSSDASAGSGGAAIFGAISSRLTSAGGAIWTGVRRLLVRNSREGEITKLRFGGFRGAVGNRSEAHPIDGYFHPEVDPQGNLSVMCGELALRKVRCTPAPDAFNPCEDVMGTTSLRVAVWLVVVAAVSGNVAVLLVLLSSQFGMSVSKLLMCQLALADLCMGAYLLLLAAVDAHTIGTYFNHAIPWQHGWGCQVAGFLTVFASELSIFTLTVITLERWYAITYAIHLNRRLKIRTAAKVMAFGWVLSTIVAALPLVGVSNYTKTSICLPMETRSPRDLAYLTSLLTGNGLAFVLICACYGHMYASIAGGRRHASASGTDTTVAKRMALLVFTDFACWAPIAFFGLTAVAGYPLIDVPHSKILLVFFYPLNSCANPFLYAILTKQYRRDLFVLLSRYGFCTRRALKYKDTSSVLHTVPNNRIQLVSLHSTPASGNPEKIEVERESESHSSTHKGSPHPIRNSRCANLSLSE